MPLVFPVVLLLILGAVTLASRSTNSYLAATKQSDARAARQAAESGMSRVITAMNPSAKGASDPYFGFLLASSWAADTWVVATRDAAAMRDLLNDCRLSSRGQLASQTTPSLGAYPSLLSGVIGTARNNTEMRYRVVDYLPPVTASSREGSPPWPASCGAFLNPTTKEPPSLTGGSAQISVEGQLWRNGRQVASHVLTRTLDVQGAPFPDLPANWETLAFRPGPPIALRVTGTVAGEAKLNSAVYPNFETDANPTILGPTNRNSIGRLRPMCRACTFQNGQTTSFPAGDADLPQLYPFDTDNPPFPPLRISADKPNYPFTVPVPDLNKLEANCKKTEDIPKRPPGEIDCWITTIGPSLNLSVNTELRPVNLIITGDVGAQDPPGPVATLPGPPIACPKPASKFVTIKHLVKGGTYYDHADLSTRPFWNRLRIFGASPTAPTTQTFYIRADKASGHPSLAGTFVWLPRGNLAYGNRNGGSDNIYTLTFKPAPLPPTCEESPGEASPGELLSSWWLGSGGQSGDLTLNLSGPLDYILPLYGNPDAMSAILPGAYRDAAGEVVADPRFPVYPLQQRIRSIY